MYERIKKGLDKIQLELSIEANQLIDNALKDKDYDSSFLNSLTFLTKHIPTGNIESLSIDPEGYIYSLEQDKQIGQLSRESLNELNSLLEEINKIEDLLDNHLHFH